MTNETLNKLCKYEERLQQVLAEATINDPANDVEELIEYIEMEKIKTSLERIEQYKSLVQIQEALSKLAEKGLSRKEKDQIISELETIFAAIINGNSETMVSLTGSKNAEISRVYEWKNRLIADNDKLLPFVYNEQGVETELLVVEQDIEDIIAQMDKNILEIGTSVIKDELYTLSLCKTGKRAKKNIFDRYSNLVEKDKEELINAIVDEMENTPLVTITGDLEMTEENNKELLNDNETIIKEPETTDDKKTAVLDDGDYVTVEDDDDDKTLDDEVKKGEIINFEEEEEEEIIDDEEEMGLVVSQTKSIAIVDDKKELEVISKKELAERTKQELAKKDNKLTAFFKKHWKKLTATVLIIGGICIAAKSCDAKPIVTPTNPTGPEGTTQGPTDNTTPTEPNIEDIYENADKTVMEQLVNKGYSGYAAMLMVTNFSEETINTLLTIPYIAEVENFVDSKEFNINYINDYQTAYETYNLSGVEAVDYVNRAYLISRTNFYQDATINEIVEVLNAVNNKELVANDALNQSINNGLTEIYNNYAFTEEENTQDSNKIDALMYFAKEDTDLDNFLTEYSQLVENILNAKGNAEETEVAQRDMYNFLSTFALGYAGNTTNIENMNENAIVTDTADWNMAYESFVKPLMSMYITENNLNEYIELQSYLAEINENWKQTNTAEYTLSLGGK